MLGRIKSYLKLHSDNLCLHTFVIGLLLLFSVAYSMNGVAAIASIYVVFVGWLFAPLYWLGIIAIMLSIFFSAYFPSYILKKRYPKQPYIVSLAITVGIMLMISAPVTFGLWKLYLHTGF